MKKLLLILCIFSLGFVGVLLPNQTQVYADEVEVVELNNQNFFTTIKETGSYILTQDVTLEGWIPLTTFSGTLDGNGYVVTLDNMFCKNLTNATITNIGFKLSDEFLYDDTNYLLTGGTGSANFGLIAQSASGSTVTKTFVEGSAIVKVKLSSSVGGMFGKVESGSLIKDCYAKVDLMLEQHSNNAINTIIGGLVGEFKNSTLSNCYSQDLASKGLVAVVDSAIEQNAITQVVAGGLIGYADNEGRANIYNCFTTSSLDVSFLHTSQIYCGKIIGKLIGFESEDLSCVYSTNTDDEQLLIAYTDGYVNNNICVRNKTEILTNIANDSLGIWDIHYGWDSTICWVEKSDNLILQVFENFPVEIDQSQNGPGINYSIMVNDGVQNTQTSDTVFKYGTKLVFVISITDEFAAYKNIKALSKTGEDIELPLTRTGEGLAEYQIEVNAESSGSYYISSENIMYNLVIKTQNIDMGGVYHSASHSSQEEISWTIEYGGQYTFNAEPSSISYAFEKWMWITTKPDIESDVEAIRGENEEYSAQRKINVAFGQSGNDSTLTYLTVDNGIPYDEATRTFTIQANFSTNVTKLDIISELSQVACDVYVDGMLIQDSSPDLLFSGNIQVGRNIEIKIVPYAGFKFQGWIIESGKNFNDLVVSGDVNSDTITINISSSLTLKINMESDTENTLDLTWLWYGLGGAGGVAVIVLAVIMIIKRSKSDDFMSNY